MNKQNLLIGGFYYINYKNPFFSTMLPWCIKVIENNTNDITTDVKIRMAYVENTNTLDENAISQLQKIEINDFILLALGFKHSNDSFAYENTILTKKSNTYSLENQSISTMDDLQNAGFYPNCELGHMNHILLLNTDKDKAVIEMEQCIKRNGEQVLIQQLANELAAKLSWIFFTKDDIDLFYRYSLLLGKKIKKTEHHFCL